MNLKKSAVVFAALLGLMAPAAAQTEGPKPASAQFCRFDFAIKEVEGGKTVKTHNYQMIVGIIGGKSSIRSGARVPVTDGKATTYIDVGVNLDVNNLITTREGLEFDLVAEVSGTFDTGTSVITRPPMVYQTRWNSRVQLHLGQPATIFASDDPSSKHQLQLEVTANPLH